MSPSRDKSGAALAASRAAAIAVLAGLVALVAGIGAESLIIGAVRGDRRQLEWISDALLSLAVVGMTYLWLHLRASRTRVLELERGQIVLGEQLRLAAEIQRNLLPALPASTPGFRWAARMIPAGWVGGDFYDFLQPSDGTALAILGDVSGKGIPAALIQSSLKALFRMIARDTTDPAEIADNMSTALYQETAGMPYATAIVVRLDNAAERLTYANAGHPSGFLLRDGVVHSIESGGPPLGLLPGTQYASVDIELQPGDLGVLVTDGITEALEGVPMTVPEALRGRGGHSAARRSPSEIADDLLRVAAAAPGPVGVEGWEDDRTVFVFRVEPGA